RRSCACEESAIQGEARRKLAAARDRPTVGWCAAIGEHRDHEIRAYADSEWRRRGDCERLGDSKREGLGYRLGRNTLRWTIRNLHREIEQSCGRRSAGKRAVSPQCKPGRQTTSWRHRPIVRLCTPSGVKAGGVTGANHSVL